MADVADTLPEWSTTLASNGPAGTTSVGTGLAPNLQQIQAVVKGWLASKGSDIASASTTDLGAVAGLAHDITGTTTITSFGTIAAGTLKVVKFEGALTLTHNATSLILPGAANITTADGDVAIMLSEGSGNWRCVSYIKSSAAPIAMSPITNSLASDVALNNGSNFFTGPTVAQGTAGTWFASGTVTLVDTAGTATFNVKLWDGTTVISATRVTSNSTGNVTASLSGYIASPAGNIRISVQDLTSTSGKIVYNDSGTSKDSTLTAIRIA